MCAIPVLHLVLLQCTTHGLTDISHRSYAMRSQPMKCHLRSGAAAFASHREKLSAIFTDSWVVCQVPIAERPILPDSYSHSHDNTAHNFAHLIPVSAHHTSCVTCVTRIIRQRHKMLDAIATFADNAETGQSG